MGLVFKPKNYLQQGGVVPLLFIESYLKRTPGVYNIHTRTSIGAENEIGAAIQEEKEVRAEEDEQGCNAEERRL